MEKIFSTGLYGLDKTLDNLRMGDNVVWQVDHLNDYAFFSNCFLKSARQSNKKIIYFRFGEHKELFPGEKDIILHPIDPYEGFETFAREIHCIIENSGQGTLYVFDCLSELLTVWATDLMIANFFHITCPFLFELNTIAYFAILRGRHSFKTVGKIRDTTQILLDLYNCNNTYYLHPLKVWKRFSPTMYLPHIRQGNDFIPLTSSFDSTQLFTHICKIKPESSGRNLDYWEKMFLQAEELSKDENSLSKQQNMKEQIVRVMITKETRMLKIVNDYFSLNDLIHIKSRLIGTGYIGGKSAGMLLARQILSRDHSEEWSNILEPHDSFYVGSDVFYTFIVRNQWWKEWIEQKTKEGYFKTAGILRNNFLNGSFPEEIKSKFVEMLEHFGQSPIIVRSSSLLEDSYGNAFSGKYDSYFCPNQGSLEERYEHFIEAVRKIYASTMNKDALEYRMQRGLSEIDEQMALLVQRVSGSYKNSYFFPDAAGVGASYNTFSWNNEINPDTGLLRLVVGLGTRAVNRVEGDYPAVIALDYPQLSPYGNSADMSFFTQNNIDGLNMATRSFETFALSDLISNNILVDSALLVQRDFIASRRLAELGMKEREIYRINFQGLIEKTSFCRIMKNMLATLESVYQYPVDIEYTVNIDKKEHIWINLVQCRPLQTKLPGERVELPQDIPVKKILFSSIGNYMGGSIHARIDWIILVVPEEYTRLTEHKKHYLARLIGKVNKKIREENNHSIFLLGPGRWGSSTAAMGVPVHFSEIKQITGLGEVAFQSGNLVPELSFGSHFFNDLIETNIFYVALFPDQENVLWQENLLYECENQLGKLLPDEKDYDHVLKVYYLSQFKLIIVSDIIAQKIIGYYE